MGQRMRWARELEHPVQRQFAKLIGFDAPVVTKVELGTQAASALIIREYAEKLRVTTEYLLYGRFQPQAMDREKKRRLEEEHPELLALQKAIT